MPTVLEHSLAIDDAFAEDQRAPVDAVRRGPDRFVWAFVDFEYYRPRSGDS